MTGIVYILSIGGVNLANSLLFSMNNTRILLFV